MIRLLIVDDHAMVREGLKAFLAPQSNFQVVGEASDGEEALMLALRLKPDVILLDLVMPKVDGIEATRRIRKEIPDARILILTSFSEDEKVISALRAGALGYLLKDSTPQELQAAIGDLAKGESYLPPVIARKVVRAMATNNTPAPVSQNGDELTDRENEILRLVARGMSNQEIAQSLVLSEWTVRSHISSILRKLELENRTQAALYALRSGLVSLDH